MRMSKQFKIFQIAVLVLVALSYGLYKQALGQKIVTEPSADVVFVQRIVDGDTLKLSDGRKARLIGVDTPEIHYSEKLVRDSRRVKKDLGSIKSLGKEARDFTRILCERKKIIIYTDIQKHDRYGRLLIYAYLDDGTFVNAKILSEGYGQVMTIPPNIKHSEHFLELEREARKARRGLWAKTDKM